MIHPSNSFVQTKVSTVEKNLKGHSYQILKALKGIPVRPYTLTTV